MRDHPYIAPRRRRPCDHVYSGNRHLAAGGQSAGGCDADGGRLSGSIRSQQAEDLALLNREVDAIDSNHALLFLIDLGQAADFNDH